MKAETYNPDEFLIRIGDLSTRFSIVEFAVYSILARLLDATRDAVVGELISDEFTLYQSLRFIRKIAPIRYCHDAGMCDEILKLCDAVEELRPTRNLFVHGDWRLGDAEYVVKNCVACLDMKWRAVDKTGQRWSRGEPHIFSLADLDDLIKKVGRLTGRALDLRQRLWFEKMMPHAAKQKPKEKDKP